MKTTLLIAGAFFVIWLPACCFGSDDLEDGISIEDDSIDDYYELKKIEQNINYKIRNEISKIYTKMDTDKIKKYKDGASINSVQVAPGSKVQNITIIDKSKGNKTAISK